ncbi:hypothetical protein AAFP30_09495 [Gordonia sp. CPCC 205515]|uniref:hypothetical protein n=1 Tax=Gordonia sp. CPCC 205515 TaxID=3140791 RepID=UPI003AF3A10E
MSARTSPAGHLRRLPFGIGTVTIILIAVMVGSVGAVLAFGGSDEPATFDNGRLRPYPGEPAVAWSVSSDNLPGYRSDAGIDVVDSWQDRWLLSYPSGLGRAFLLVKRTSGEHLWSQPVVVGLGGCAITDDGRVGCAIKLGGVPDGFYLIDDDGTPTDASSLDDTAQVVGVGRDFLRIDQAGYRVAMHDAGGREIWSRTFAAAAKASWRHEGVLTIQTVDGARFIVNPTTGRDRLACTQCTITVFATGITVQYNESGRERVATHAIENGAVDERPTSQSPSLRVLAGPSTLPVLTGTGVGQIDATQGRYEIRDPAQSGALWQITDSELSKANTRPCGEQVALALKDRSRVFYRLADGKRLGTLGPPALDNPDANIDQLSCVGSSESTLVFANNNQITAYDTTHGDIAWSRSVIGPTTVTDGFIVVHEGTSMTVLAPN